MMISQIVASSTLKAAQVRLVMNDCALNEYIMRLNAP